MGNRLPEWLQPRCPISVARKLGGTTRRQHLGFEGYSALGRLGGAASAAAHTPEEIAAACARARASRSLPLWRAAGFVVDVAPMPFVHFAVLRQVRDRPGVHARSISTTLGLCDRSVHNACRALVAMGYVDEVAAASPGRGKRVGLGISGVGRAVLERVNEILK